VHASLGMRPFHTFFTALLPVLLAASRLSGVAHAAPVLGFVETWPGTGLQGCGSGPVLSNPVSDGTGGTADGYLRFRTPNAAQHNPGANSFGAEYTGDWIAAGITQVRLWLNDVEADDPLEMRFSIGDGTNSFWQSDVAFLPPHEEWAEFVVDLTNPANSTQTIGTGTFAEALQTVDRVHVRHDRPPFFQTPDPLDGDVGRDHVLLTNGTVGVEPRGSTVPNALRLGPPTPNPSRVPVAFTLEVFGRGPVRVEIVDASGRLVRRGDLEAAGPGTLVWTWDGRDTGGRPTPAGHYRVRATRPLAG